MGGGGAIHLQRKWYANTVIIRPVCFNCRSMKQKPVSLEAPYPAGISAELHTAHKEDHSHFSTLFFHWAPVCVSPQRNSIDIIAHCTTLGVVNETPRAGAWEVEIKTSLKEKWPQASAPEYSFLWYLNAMKNWITCPYDLKPFEFEWEVSIINYPCRTALRFQPMMFNVW